MTEHPPPAPPSPVPSATAPPMAPPIATNGQAVDGSGADDARIYSRGYRRYEGERTGTTGSVVSLVRHSVRHALGLGRSARHKVLPFFIVFIAYLPAAAIVGAVALFPIDPGDFLPTYAEYYGFVTAAIYLFAGLVGPQLLCSDRRTGMLGVYLAAALNRPLYLVGKAVSVFLLLLLVTLGPPLLMLISLSLQSLGPDGFVEWIRVFFRILASSAVLGMLFMAVSLAVAATTDRTMIASASVLAIIPGSTIVTATMVDGVGLSPHLRLFDILVLPQAIIFDLHDEFNVWPTSENPTWTVYLAWLGWMAACLGWVWFRYRRLLVRR